MDIPDGKCYCTNVMGAVSKTTNRRPAGGDHASAPMTSRASGAVCEKAYGQEDVMGTYFIEKIRNGRLVGHGGSCKDFTEARAVVFELNKLEGKGSARRKPWTIVFVPE